MTYSDGAGREVLKKMQAEPGPDLLPRWVGSGRTVVDNKGNPIKKYEPYFSPDSSYEVEAAMTGVTPILRYDPLGRLIRTDFPDGTLARADFDAWSHTAWDQNDTVLESAWYASRAALPVGDPARRAADLAAKHASTPTVTLLDALGRAFVTIEDNGTETYETKSVLDIQGNRLAVVDARGNRAEARTFSPLGATLHLVSGDAGDRWGLADIGGHPVREWDGRSAVQRTYDRLHRPSHVYVQQDGGTPWLAERTVYGEALANGKATNARTRVHQQYDGAGVVTNTAYDFKGNLLEQRRRLALDYRAAADWTSIAPLVDATAIDAAANARLEAESFETISAFDALNRVTSAVSHDQSEVLPTYNEAGLLEELKVLLRGAATPTAFVTNFDYNAKGQRVRADYANGTSTTYAYDPLTFLLARQTTIRAVDPTTGANDGRRLQDLAFTYDPVHNVVEIGDDADASLFFRGTVPVAGGGQYEYDAVYRLVSATGREHPGQQMPDRNDAPLAAVPHPNDTQALRAYLEEYAYDQVGNLQHVLHRQRLPNGGNGGWTRHYAYAADSNRLQRTSLPGDPDQGPFSGVYAHDATGNMQSMPGLAAIDWDQANRMRRADLGGGGTSYYAYDASGARVRKVIQRTATLVEERIYVGAFELYRQRVGSAVQAELHTLHVMDDKRRVAMVETETVVAGNTVPAPIDQLRYPLTNHLESSAVEVDARGALVTYEEYFPFGGTSFHSARGGLEVSAKRYQYTGKERDDETGLYYYGARYYAPWLGRWTSSDPSGLSAGINLFAYSRGNPISRRDPGGLQDQPAQPPAAARDTADEKIAVKLAAELGLTLDQVHELPVLLGRPISAGTLRRQLVDAGILKDPAAKPQTALDEVISPHPYNPDRVVTVARYGPEAAVAQAQDAATRATAGRIQAGLSVAAGAVAQARMTSAPALPVKGPTDQHFAPTYQASGPNIASASGTPRPAPPSGRTSSSPVAATPRIAATAGTTPATTAPAAGAPTGIPAPPAQIPNAGAGWLPGKQLWSKGKLGEHFAKHGAEVGTSSAPEYSKTAAEFGSAPNTGQYIDMRSGAFFYRYEPATNRIFVGTDAGQKIKTFYQWDGRSTDTVITSMKSAGLL